MPRRPRLKLAAVPLHIIQRGNNRGACFFAEDDYQFYLDHLGQACKKYRVDLHAYVLMTNHAHLLLTSEDGDGPSQVMKQLGQRWAGENPLKLSLAYDPAFVPLFDWTKMQYCVLIEQIDLVSP